MKQFFAKIKLSKFDLGMLIAFGVLTLIAVGVWWYLSGVLTDAQTEVTSAKADFDKYSSNPQFHVVVSSANEQTLETNVEAIKTQLVPVIQTVFLSKDNKLKSIHAEDPVAWKSRLDEEVRRLTASAKAHNVAVPPNYYFGFSRYLNVSPSDQQTEILSKQILGIDQITNILIGAQVKSIEAIRRSYEEDTHSGSGSSPSTSLEGDRLSGYAQTAAGGTYTAYPFQVEFHTSPENYRTVMDSLIQSPYVFVVRSLSVKNSTPNSPQLNDLDHMAGTPPASVTGSSPGEVAATTSTVGPQYLFGNSVLNVVARIDMIEWNADVATITDGGKSASPQKGKP